MPGFAVFKVLALASNIFRYFFAAVAATRLRLKILIKSANIGVLDLNVLCHYYR